MCNNLGIFAQSIKTCVQKTYRGPDNPMVCVCNSTYCDEFPPLGVLQPGQAAIYTSSISGKRFERTNQMFSANSSNDSSRACTILIKFSKSANSVYSRHV